MIAAADWLWRRVRSMFFVKPPVAPASPVITEVIPVVTTDSQVVSASPVVAGAVVPNENINHSRRHFFHAAGVLAGAVPFVSAGYGFLAERFRFQVREIEIPIGNLPESLNGMRITQLSDIHIGSYMPAAEVRRAVSLANELGGDMTVVTGDFVSTRNDPLEDCITELSRLRAPLGVWGCNGNHEIYARAEEKAATLFHQFGMKLLRRENAELRWQGSAFNLIGVDYQRERDAEGNRAAKLVGLEPLVRHDIPNILLSHNPNSFPRAAELGIELSLAGHTHGGQVRVEILDHGLNLAKFFTPYVAGPFRRPLYSPRRLFPDGVEVSASLSSGPATAGPRAARCT